VPVDPPGGDIGEVERGGAWPADAAATLHDHAQRVQIVVEIMPVLERQSCAQHRFRESVAAAHANRLAVEEGALSATCGEEPAAGGVEDHTDGNGVVDPQRDRHAVIRDAVEEVGSAVERIDDPGVARRPAFAGLLGLVRMRRESRRQRVDDRPLGALVDFADEIVRRLALDGQARAIARAFLDDGAGRARRFHGAGKECRGIVAHRSRPGQ
jgi:hypothetical protein